MGKVEKRPVFRAYQTRPPSCIMYTRDCPQARRVSIGFAGQIGKRKTNTQAISARLRKGDLRLTGRSVTPLLRHHDHKQQARCDKQKGSGDEPEPFQ
jgi:hypothetical protein